jgi:hypothetical protein
MKAPKGSGDFHLEVGNLRALKNQSHQKLMRQSSPVPVFDRNQVQVMNYWSPWI